MSALHIAPKIKLDSLVVPTLTGYLIRDLIAEWKDPLPIAGLPARNRILLLGPSGNGKASLAEALAYELRASFLPVPSDSLLKEPVNYTIARLTEIVESAKRHSCATVIFLEDVEQYQRGADKEFLPSGDISKLLAFLYRLVMDLPDRVMLVASSTCPSTLFQEILTWFQVVVEMPPPDEVSVPYLVNTVEKEFGVRLPPLSAAELYLCGEHAVHFRKISMAEIREVYLDILRISHCAREDFFAVAVRVLKQRHARLLLESKLKADRVRFSIPERAQVVVPSA